MERRAGNVLIGISGWRYAPWRGDFYPDGLPQRRELEFASRAIGSIEINGSFYALQTPKRYASWHADTPARFVFSVKAPRYITHIRRLRDIETPLANFFASGVLQLQQKLGPILWQFPPSMKFDAPLFESFLEQLPHTGAAAIALARHSDRRLRKSGHGQADAKRRLRHAVEIRNHSFACDEFIDQLRRHNVALVVADTAGKWPLLEDVTADFLYLRLHGDEELYKSGYSNDALERWKKRIDRWRRGGEPADAQRCASHRAPTRQARDVYCYFDNDVKVRAPYDARTLIDKLKLGARLEAMPGEDLASFDTLTHRGAA